MKNLRFRLVTFFLHVKPDLLILVSGYSESYSQIYFTTLFIFLSLINVLVYDVFLHLIYKIIIIIIIIIIITITITNMVFIKI